MLLDPGPAGLTVATLCFRRVHQGPAAVRLLLLLRRGGAAPDSPVAGCSQQRQLRLRMRLKLSRPSCTRARWELSAGPRAGRWQGLVL